MVDPWRCVVFPALSALRVLVLESERSAVAEFCPVLRDCVVLGERKAFEVYSCDVSPDGKRLVTVAGGEIHTG